MCYIVGDIHFFDVFNITVELVVKQFLSHRSTTTSARQPQVPKRMVPLKNKAKQYTQHTHQSFKQQIQTINWLVFMELHLGCGNHFR